MDNYEVSKMNGKDNLALIRSLRRDIKLLRKQVVKQEIEIKNLYEKLGFQHERELKPVR